MVDLQKYAIQNTKLARWVVFHLYGIMVFLSNVSFGQSTELFLRNTCLPDSVKFKDVQIIDLRDTNQTLGFVQKGLMNRVSAITFEGSFTDSLAAFYKTSGVGNNDQGKMVMVLSEFYISERAEEIKEIGRFKLALRVFIEKETDQFQEAYSIDTAYKSISGMDITNKLLNSVSEHLCSIGLALAETRKNFLSDGPVYSYQEILVLDSLEKLKIPIYTAEKINKGIYYTYQQFRDNNPDTTTVYIVPGQFRKYEVYTLGKKGRKNKIDFNAVYAVNDGKKLLKATSIDFYDLKKEGNDFYFIGETAFTNANNDVNWGIAFGLVGAALVNSSQNMVKLYEFRINHKRGNSVPIKRVQ